MLLFLTLFINHLLTSKGYGKLYKQPKSTALACCKLTYILSTDFPQPPTLTPVTSDNYFWWYSHNDWRAKQEYKLLRESYFYKFRKLKNNIKFFVQNTFINNTGLGFDLKQ